MSPIQVSAAPKEKDFAAFTKAARHGVSKVANLCGWPKEIREHAMFSIVFDEAVDEGWDKLQRHAQDGAPVPIWEWNKFVRGAVHQVVASVYAAD